MQVGILWLFNGRCWNHSGHSPKPQAADRRGERTADGKPPAWDCRCDGRWELPSSVHPFDRYSSIGRAFQITLGWVGLRRKWHVQIPGSAPWAVCILPERSIGFPFVVVGWILHRLFLLIRIVVCLFDYQLDMTPFHLFCHYTWYLKQLGITHFLTPVNRMTKHLITAIIKSKWIINTHFVPTQHLLFLPSLGRPLTSTCLPRTNGSSFLPFILN